MRDIHGFAADIYGSEPSVGVVFFRCRGGGIRAACAYGKHRFAGIDEFLVQFVFILFRITIGNNGERATDFHARIPAHKYPATRTAVCQCSTVDEGHPLIGILKDRLHQVRYLTAILVVVYAARAHARSGNAAVEDTVDGIELMRKQLTEQPCGIIPVLCPVVIPVDAERYLRPVAKPLIPVNRARVSRFGSTVAVEMSYPGPAGSVAVGCRLYEVYLTEHAFLYQICSEWIYGVVAYLMAELIHRFGIL